MKPGLWQGQKDSNPQERFWRPECYHYIMPLYLIVRWTIKSPRKNIQLKMMVDRQGLEPRTDRL